jgi:uncharacterized protein YdhG (YjbR/CyaY superfamily)
LFLEVLENIPRFLNLREKFRVKTIFRKSSKAILRVARETPLHTKKMSKMSQERITQNGALGGVSTIVSREE